MADETIPMPAFDHAMMCVAGAISAGRANGGGMQSLKYAWARYTQVHAQLRADVYGADTEDERAAVFDQAIETAAMAIRLAVTASSLDDKEP